jgi:hypothetical protein
MVKDANRSGVYHDPNAAVPDRTTLGGARDAHWCQTYSAVRQRDVVGRTQVRALDDRPQDNFSDNETSGLYPGELYHVQLISYQEVLVSCAMSHVGPFYVATHQLPS